MPLTKRITLCLLSSHRWHATVQVDALLDIEMYRNAHSGELGVLSGVCTWEQLQGMKTQFILPEATALRAYLP